jgi:transposase-like protein
MWGMIFRSEPACGKRGRAVRLRCKGTQGVKDSMLTCVRWYGADPVSERQVEERRQARGGAVDHATSTRWGRQDAPPLEEAFHHRTRPVWVRGRMAET